MAASGGFSYRIRYTCYKVFVVVRVFSVTFPVWTSSYKGSINTYAALRCDSNASAAQRICERFLKCYYHAVR